MSKQSDKKVIDRILNYPHKEKGCVYLCGPHLDPCVMVRGHDGKCQCRECHSFLKELFRIPSALERTNPCKGLDDGRKRVAKIQEDV